MRIDIPVLISHISRLVLALALKIDSERHLKTVRILAIRALIDGPDAVLDHHKFAAR
jgi:hypothetical protein